MSSPHAHAGDAPPDPRRWIGLFVLLIANFMNLIDVTIVNVALPSMRESLGASDNQIEWGVWGGMTERKRRALLRRRPNASWRAVLEQAREQHTGVVVSA